MVLTRKVRRTLYRLFDEERLSGLPGVGFGGRFQGGRCRVGLLRSGDGAADHGDGVFQQFCSAGGGESPEVSQQFLFVNGQIHEGNLLAVFADISRIVPGWQLLISPCQREITSGDTVHISGAMTMFCPFRMEAISS